MSHLRRYLEPTGALPADHLDAATRRQQIYGGSLDSVLLELELIDPHTLGELLVQACGLPLAPFELIDDERDRPWHALPDDIIEIGWAVPLCDRSGTVWIGVHPDLPNERLGALYRMMPGVQAFVLPECALEKIAAERTVSVVPQRYAVLCVAYLSALRRRPSVSDVGFPMLHDPGSMGSFDMFSPDSGLRGVPRPAADDDRDPTQPPIATGAPGTSPEPEDEFERRATIVYQPNPMLPLDDDSSSFALALTDPPSPALEPGDTSAGTPLHDDDGAATSEEPGAPAAPMRGRTLIMGRGSVPVVPPPPSVSSPRPQPQLDIAAPPDPDDRTRVASIEMRMAAAASLESGPHTRAQPEPPPPPPPPPPTTTTELGAPTRDGTTDDAGAIVLSPARTVVGGPPPVRFTARGTMISTGRDLELSLRSADIAGRISSVNAELDRARTRDGAMESLATALAILSPRFAILRVRGRELVGLGSPQTALPDPAGRVVPIGSVGFAARVMADSRNAGVLDDDGFARALSLSSGHPCLARRVDVAGRPTLLVYVDRGGDEFLPAEAALLDEVCAHTSRALETVVKLRQSERTPGDDTDTRPSPLRPPTIDPPPSFGVTPGARPWTPSTAARRLTPPPVDLIPTDGPRARSTIVDGSPPVRRPTDAPRPRPTTPIDGPYDRQIDGFEPLAPAAAPAAERATEPYTADRDDDGARRVTSVGGAPQRADAPVGAPSALPPDHTPRGAHMLTIHAMPPPPPLPPPPPMADEASSPIDTLMGLPPPVSSHARGPRFVPPPLDDRDNANITPLSSPIDQPSMRGRIELDEEDWAHPGKQLASESMQRRVDSLLRAIAGGSGNVGDLRAIGEPALLRLAAQFPGPLEILRRDLRALPPPSAHGPLVRTAIRVGAELVPHLIDLFDHPSADVRFYAAFVFQELRDARAMRPLSELAFDTSGDVRVISMRVLETYSRVAGFDDASRVVRAQLDSTNRTRQLYAARAVGTLRDIDAIGKLIDLLSSRDRFVQEAALESLCSITGQQLGLKPHRWKSWYGDNADRHRVEWIIDSLEHRDVPVRRWAADELTRITGHRVPFSAIGDKRARDLAIEAWTQWWTERGRAQLEQR
ncbi:MAG: hypothetical protein IPN32_21240 [Deltaproteobacteria bacterium]|nr:hypothetical protein [Deltaproteobacteria bacterium]